MAVYYEKALELIGKGMRNKDIAEALGCDPSSISHIRRGAVIGAYTRESSLARFKHNLEKDVVVQGGCWLLTTSLLNNGYAVRSMYGKREMAHRASYMAYVGPIPAGMQVCHSCDVRNCVNPKHLFLGTQKDNEDDKNSKGRTPKGESHYSAVLTEDLVRKLRAEYSPGDSWMGLERIYGVNRGVLRSAILGFTWKHVK